MVRDRCDICFGPPRDGRPTFQRLDRNPRWVGVPDLDDAGPRAVTAYLRTYGPATVDHVHYWLGSGLSAGRRRLDRRLSGLREQLVAVDVHVTPQPRRDAVTRKANLVVHGGVVRGTWTRKGDELMATWLDERRAPTKTVEQVAARLSRILRRELDLRLTS